MSLKITNLALPVEAPEEALVEVCARKLNIPREQILNHRLLRKSLDARSRDRLKFVYTLTLDLADESGLTPHVRQIPGVELYSNPQFEEPEAGEKPLQHPPVIIGSGPAGLLAGYYLALRGFRPIILERGGPVKERVPAIREFDRGGEFQAENNYLFGEGGAGTFSDGKLTCRMSGPDVEWVLDQFVACGGRASLRYEYRPHLGSNRLPMLVRNFRRKIEELGGEYRFYCRFESLDLLEGQVRGVHTSSGLIPASVVILAIGHSARDTYQTLFEQGIPLKQKPFQMGLRIEHPQELINRHKYGRRSYVELLGAADYSLIANGPTGDVFTFCMCAGGYVIPSVSEPGMFCTNGMSHSRHDSEFANSGLVVTYDPSAEGMTHPLAGMEIQRKFEAIAYQLGRGTYRAPIHPAVDYVAGRTPQESKSYPCSMLRGVIPVDLREVLPPAVTRVIQEGLPIMDRKWGGGYLQQAMLVGPEMRGSSPVRIDRDRSTFQACGWEGIYPIGEGAGYAGGIVSAAVDGLRAAKAIVRRYASLTGDERRSAVGQSER